MASANSPTIENSPWKWLALKSLDAALKGDRRGAEMAAIRVLRRLKIASEPDTELLSSLLVSETGFARNALRAKLDEPAPLDGDSGLGILKVEQVSKAFDGPILDEELEERLRVFVKERQEAHKLISAGLMPSSTLLFSGPPGTGKTMLARALAGRLEMRFATLDLATSVSSFLGKTGLNLRRALDYARTAPTLLLMDEFDALAKRRDDASDVGELKRVVNTLLKELENWPTHSVLIAATNHEALLDPAIYRRFDSHWRLGMPDQERRKKILLRSLPPVEDTKLIDILAFLTEQHSPADIESLTRRILRIQILDGKTVGDVLISIIPSIINTDLPPKEKTNLIRNLRTIGGKQVPIRILAEWFQLSESTIHHHLHSNDPKER